MKRAMFWLAIFVIVLLTVTPNVGEGADPRTLMYCIACGYAGTTDFLLNLLLFVPFGVARRTLGTGLARTVLHGFLLSLAIELLQLTIIPGRFASPGDLLANTAGAWGGWIIASRWRLLVHPDPPTARRLASVGGLGVTIILGVTAWMLQPSLPDSVWYGQWKAELGTFDLFTGDVTAAALDGKPLPPLRLPDTPLRRRALVGRAITLEGWGTSGSRTERIAPIVSIYDDHQRLIALLGQQHADLVYIPRTRAHDARLRPPRLRVPRALSAAPGESLFVSGTLGAGRLEAHSRILGVSTTAAHSLSVGQGWSLLLPWEIPLTPFQSQLMTLAWLLALTMMVARATAQGWGRETVPRSIHALVLAAALGLMLAVSSWAGGLPFPSWPEWGGLGGGLLLGGWSTRFGPSTPS